MAALAFIGFWILAAVTLFVVAISGGPKRARERVLQASSTRGRRVASLVIAAAFLIFGIALPAIVIASNQNDDKAGDQGVTLTAAQLKGRELFGQTCNECHTLAAAGTVGKIGPNLDKLRPPKSLVLDALANGRSRGIGRMPAQLLTGPNAKDVADFVARVAGRN